MSQWPITGVPRIALSIAASLLLALTATAASAAGNNVDQAELAVVQHEKLGSYLVDKEGRSLYLFEKDEDGESQCYEACAQAWPPLLTSGQVIAGDGVDEDKIDTVDRKDGTQQVTYGGWPLYYFTPDKQPGDIKGQDVDGFGAEWYLVKPEGEKVGHGDS